MQVCARVARLRGRTEGGDAQAIDSGGKRPGTARKGGRREGVGRGLPPVKSNGEGKERSGEVSGLSKGTLLLRELRCCPSLLTSSNDSAHPGRSTKSLKAGRPR